MKLGRRLRTQGGFELNGQHRTPSQPFKRAKRARQREDARANVTRYWGAKRAGLPSKCHNANLWNCVKLTTGV